MNNADDSNSERAFDELLAYFSQNKNDNPDPIFHPDNSVNKMMSLRPSPLRKASVLIPITRHKPGKNSEIVLTVRSENLNSHPGQISLPGGSEEAIDSDVVATALRESEEEIGLAPGRCRGHRPLGRHGTSLRLSNHTHRRAHRAGFRICTLSYRGRRDFSCTSLLTDESRLLQVHIHDL